MHGTRPAPTTMFWYVLTLGPALAGAAAMAQTPVSSALSPPAVMQAPQPYQPVAVQLAEEHADASFVAFRSELAEVARSRVYAELARIVVAHSFFWERDFAGAFDPQLSAAENLAAAIGLERNNGAGWRWLAAIAAEATATAMDSRPGVICTPARPAFDIVEFNRLIDLTQSERADWGYPRMAGIEVRARPAERGALVEKLGLHFVRILGFEAAENERDAARTTWARVATPNGKTGFVVPGALISPSTERLCFRKDVTGRWRIAGFVGSGE